MNLDFPVHLPPEIEMKSLGLLKVTCEGGGGRDVTSPSSYSYFCPASVGSSAASQPLIPADITWTLL